MVLARSSALVGRHLGLDHRSKGSKVLPYTLMFLLPEDFAVELLAGRR
jgi:hypothetical protein